MNNTATRKHSRSHYAKVRRKVIGHEERHERFSDSLVRDVDRGYRYFMNKRGLPLWDSSPNMRRNAK